MREHREHMTDPALRRWKWRGAVEWWSDRESRGAGRLVAKLHQTPLRGQTKPARRITFYFSYFTDGRRRFLLVGDYPELSLAEAREKAGEHSRLYRSGTTDLHGHYEAIEKAKEKARRDAQEAQRKAEARARAHTLRELLDTYGAYLRRAGKQSAGDVASIFKLHVPLDLASQRAADVPVSEFVSILGSLVEAGKGRTAGKLRSYLRAAYALAIRSKTDPGAPLSLRAFEIDVNPIASIAAKALSKFNKARERNLKADELRHFLLRLAAEPPSVKRDALDLALLLGGQRPIQLLRAAPEDCDLSAETITLYDSKGSRQEARAHVLPLTKGALPIVRRLLSMREESPTIFTNDGKRPMRSETVSGLVTGISAAMVKAREARQGFELRDIRRTCETMLASLGVSKDIRAQVQSHGLGGVQQRHYDRYEYMLEKRAALEKWARHLEKIRSGQKAETRDLRAKHG